MMQTISEIVPRAVFFPATYALYSRQFVTTPAGAEFGYVVWQYVPGQVYQNPARNQCAMTRAIRVFVQGFQYGPWEWPWPVAPKNQPRGAGPGKREAVGVCPADIDKLLAQQDPDTGSADAIFYDPDGKLSGGEVSSIGGGSTAGQSTTSSAHPSPSSIHQLTSSIRQPTPDSLTNTSVTTVTIQPTGLTSSVPTSLASMPRPPSVSISSPWGSSCVSTTTALECAEAGERSACVPTPTFISWASIPLPKLTSRPPPCSPSGSTCVSTITVSECEPWGQETACVANPTPSYASWVPITSPTATQSTGLVAAAYTVCENDSGGDECEYQWWEVFTLNLPALTFPGCSTDGALYSSVVDTVPNPTAIPSLGPFSVDGESDCYFVQGHGPSCVHSTSLQCMNCFPNGGFSGDCVGDEVQCNPDETESYNADVYCFW